MKNILHALLVEIEDLDPAAIRARIDEIEREEVALREALRIARRIRGKRGAAVRPQAKEVPS
jgi:hypothetical protein